jgi:hypothetical protein
MRAMTVEPKVAGSARLAQVPEPDPARGSVLVEAIAVEAFAEALHRGEGDIKVVVQFAEA